MNLTCPYCGKAHDRHSAVDKEPREPKHDDLSLCIDCGKIAVFDLIGQRLRVPTSAEQAEIDANLDIAFLRAAWRAVKAKN